MAAPALPLKDILREQAKIILTLNNASEKQIIHTLEEQETFYSFVENYMENDSVPEKYLKYKNSIMWFKELFKTEPLALLEDIKCPVLILQGNKDIQVHPQNAEIIYNKRILDGYDSLQIRRFFLILIIYLWNRLMEILPIILTNPGK